MELDDSRRAFAALSDKTSALDAERNHLNGQIADLLPRAQTASLLEQQVASLKHADSARQEALDGGAKQIAELQEHAESHSSTAKYYEGQYASLFAEHDALTKQAKDFSGEYDRLKSELAAAKSSLSGTANLSAELSSAKQELDALRAKLAKSEASVGDLKKLHDQATSALSLRDAEFMQLKSDYDGKSSSAASSVQIELAKLRSDLESVNKELAAERASSTGRTEGAGALEAEITKLKSDLAAKTSAADAAATEITRLTAAASSVSQTGIDPEMYDSDVAALRGTTDDLRKELAEVEAALVESRKSMEESSMLAAQRHTEIEQLRAQLASSSSNGGDNYKRFKDALEAANRIANGLPA